ncbi:hypothetical protein [Vibrio parahaemolyticus]|uniref:hypothetical protein n=1 Tax=Vibrio parahaemolyticus TaxID=670 RepID=UPI00046F1114|nr:hypothetical protein [Vibrio parahaemolyticus]
MDWLALISGLVSSLAWPFAAVVIVLTLKSSIKTMIPNVTKFKAGPVEAEFEKAEFTREVKALRGNADDFLDDKPLNQHEEKLYQLSEINPRSAILEAWQGVELSARRAVVEKGLYEPGPESRPLLDVYRALAKYDLLAETELDLFHELRDLRNQAAHVESFMPTKESAINYIELSRKLRNRIDKANKLLKSDS